MNNGQFGEYLAKLRKDKGLTQKQLGELLKCSDKTISKWERGKYAPDIMYLKPLSEIFDISVSELLECVDNTNNQKNKNDNIIHNIKEYQKKTSKNIIIKSIIFLLVIICIFTAIIIYLKGHEWHVINLKSNDNYYFAEGNIIYNKKYIIYNIKDIKYNSEFIGTDREPYVESAVISLYDNDELISSYESSNEKPMLIHKIIQNIYFSETKENNKKSHKIKMIVSYIDRDKKEESYIIILE